MPTDTDETTPETETPAPKSRSRRRAASTRKRQAEEATEPQPEVDQPTVIDVDTSAEVNDDTGVRTDAEPQHLPVRLEESEATVMGMSLVPAREELRGIAELAVELARADNVPRSLQGKPAAVMAVMLTGRELGVAPMTALRTFHVIDGTVTVAPKVRLAMVRQQSLGQVWPDPDNDDESGTWYAIRADDPQRTVYRSTFTMAMARAIVSKYKDGKPEYLADKSNWKNYGPRMLSWRSLGYLLDDAFPEVGTGLYSPDELGAVTDEDGLPVIDVDSTEAPTTTAGRGRAAVAAEVPANPAVVADLKARIEEIKRYKGAPAKLQELWVGPDPGAWRIAPIEKLRHIDEKNAKAAVDSVEQMIKRGLFGELDADGDAPPAAPPEGSDSPPSTEGANEEHPDGPESATEAPDSPQDVQDAPAAAPPTERREPLPFDVEALRATAGGNGVNDDLRWVVQAPDDVAHELTEEVKALGREELDSRCAAIKVNTRGADEPTKRARLTAKLIRRRMERMADE